VMTADGWIRNGAVSEVECKVRHLGRMLLAGARGPIGFAVIRREPVNRLLGEPRRARGAICYVLMVPPN
jgi:hypothetical protein